MSTYSYDKTSKEILFHRNLRVFKLNNVAEVIFLDLLEGKDRAETIDLLMDRFSHVSKDIVHADYNRISDQLIGLGIDFKRSEEQFQNELTYDTWNPKVPILHIIENCNSPCKMCDCWKKKANHHSLEKLKPLFDALAAKKAELLMISGGEPLLHPELKEILQYLKEIDLGIMLNTNALALDKHEWLYGLKIEQLVFSMDGYNSQTYRDIRGVNAFDKVWKNVRTFKEKSPETSISFRLILNKFNLFHLEEYFKLAKEYNISGIGFSPADVFSDSFSRSTMNENSEAVMKDLLLPTEEEINHFLENFYPGDKVFDLLDKSKKENFTTWGPKDLIRCLVFYKKLLKGSRDAFSSELCFFPKASMVLDYNGDLKNCFYSKAFANLADFPNINWDFSSAMKDLKDREVCKSCRGKIFCGNEGF